MSYIERNLLPGEQLIFRARLSWIIFLRPLGWLVITFMLYYLTIYYDLPHFDTINLVFLSVLLLIFFADLIQFLTYITTEFGVTTQRIIVKRGIVQRLVKENLLQKIESIQVFQSFVGRIFGYGTIIVHGIGGTPEAFDLINDPMTFRLKIQEQIEKSNGNSNTNKASGI